MLVISEHLQELKKNIDTEYSSSIHIICVQFREDEKKTLH